MFGYTGTFSVFYAKENNCGILLIFLDKEALSEWVFLAADDIHKYLFIVFLEKIRLDVSSESNLIFFKR